MSAFREARWTQIWLALHQHCLWEQAMKHSKAMRRLVRRYNSFFLFEASVSRTTFI